MAENWAEARRAPAPRSSARAPRRVEPLRAGVIPFPPDDCLRALRAVIFAQDVTHVVVGGSSLFVRNGRRVSKRTMKYMQGVLTGQWVVAFDWVGACLAARRRVEEEAFEIDGDMQGGEGGAKAGRLRKASGQPPLFHGAHTPAAAGGAGARLGAWRGEKTPRAASEALRCRPPCLRLRRPRGRSRRRVRDHRPGRGVPPRRHRRRVRAPRRGPLISPRGCAATALARVGLSDRCVRVSARQGGGPPEGRGGGGEAADRLRRRRRRAAASCPPTCPGSHLLSLLISKTGH